MTVDENTWIDANQRYLIACVAEVKSILEAFLARAASKGNVAQAAAKAPQDRDEADGPVLTGRAKTIAGKMNCPCGCAHTLMECTCKTAKDIKAQLAKRDWSGMGDEEAIKLLNKEFCMK